MILNLFLKRRSHRLELRNAGESILVSLWSSFLPPALDTKATGELAAFEKIRLASCR